MGFAHFWWENIVHAWHWGHGTFWEIESLVNIATISIGCWVRVRRKKQAERGRKDSDGHGVHGHELPKDHWWHYWENNLMIGALGLSILVFFCVAAFVAPFQRYEEEHKAADNRGKEVTGLSKELASAKAELRESESARLRRVEAGQAGVTAEVRRSITEGLKLFVDNVVSNRSDADLVRLARIATNPPYTIITDAVPVDMQTLMAEHNAIQAQKEAANALAEAARSDQRAQAHAFFSRTMDAVVKIFTNQLSVLASAAGDTVLCEYNGMPASNQRTGTLAVIKLQSNASWRFVITAQNQWSSYEATVAAPELSPPISARLWNHWSSPDPTFFECSDGSTGAIIDPVNDIAKIVRWMLGFEEERFPLIRK
jgi:hypothetical protein